MVVIILRLLPPDKLPKASLLWRLVLFPSFTLSWEVMNATLPLLKGCFNQGIFCRLSALQNKHFNLFPTGKTAMLQLNKNGNLKQIKPSHFFPCDFFFSCKYMHFPFCSILNEGRASLQRNCSWYFRLSNLPEQMVPSGKLWKVLGVWLCLAPPSLLGSQMTSHQTSFPPLRGPWSSSSRIWFQGMHRPFAVGFSSYPSPQQAEILGWEWHPACPIKDAGFSPASAQLSPRSNNRSKRPGFCCQVARVGSAGARRGAGWGDALPGVCSGSGKPVGYGPAVPRRGEQEQGTGRRQDFSFLADRIKNAYFQATVASLPLPPAPPRPRHPQTSGGRRSSRCEVRKEGLRWRLSGCSERGVRDAGARGGRRAGRQCPRSGDRAPVYLVNFPPRGFRRHRRWLAQGMPCRAGREGLGEQTCQQPGTLRSS